MLILNTLTRLAGSNTAANLFRLASTRSPLPAHCAGSNGKTTENVRHFGSSNNSSGTNSSSIMNESTTPEGFRVITPKANKKREVPNITVTFKLPSGEKVSGKGREGESLLDVVADNNLDIDGFGACEGTLACSTCHLIFSKEDYDKLPKRPADEEMDMLDLAYDLCETSRLGCQVPLTKALDGLEVTVPASVNDQRLC